jgi:hypothetical protein
MAGPAMATRNSLQPGQPSEANDAAGAFLSGGNVVVKALRTGLNSNTDACCDDYNFSTSSHTAGSHCSDLRKELGVRFDEFSQAIRWQRPIFQVYNYPRG